MKSFNEWQQEQNQVNEGVVFDVLKMVVGKLAMKAIPGADEVREIFEVGKAVWGAMQNIGQERSLAGSADASYPRDEAFAVIPKEYRSAAQTYATAAAKMAYQNTESGSLMMPVTGSALKVWVVKEFLPMLLTRLDEIDKKAKTSWVRSNLSGEPAETPEGPMFLPGKVRWTGGFKA